MNLGLYGGSFDPVHRGHVIPALEAAEALGLDLIYYLPTAEPPHKEPRAAPVYRRFAMVELALLEHGNLRVSDFEMTPGSTAYTVDTVRHFGAEYPGAELFLLIGSDSLADFTQWRQWREIAELATLVVLARSGGAIDRPRELCDELENLVTRGRILFVDNPSIPYASRTIRTCIAAGEKVPDGALDPLVLDYLEKYDLYR